ncbi:uncharacterized protein LOC133183582 [Saccostrea echinata]|uniref:uncharacterized protein LOC133183582 n=1 Tax=Saccostrea echinata TaxID=191078 RepID=UPI002A825B6B|nr:uncharacterized protein LOC133183582 [Saccostrea echinata]
MKILPFQFEGTYARDGASENKEILQETSEETEFNLHEMFDVYDYAGDEVPDVTDCDLFCPESLSDEVEHNVPFSLVSSQESDNISEGIFYPPVENNPPMIFNDMGEDLNRRISMEDLSQSENETEDNIMEEQVGIQSVNVLRRTPSENAEVFIGSVIQNRDRRVPDLNGSFYDSDEERILSSCSTSDQVVPNFYMEE